jgi:malonyl-CoA decarboxylase
MEGRLDLDDRDLEAPSLLTPGEEKKVRRLGKGEEPVGWLRATLLEEAWPPEPAVEKVLRPILLRLGARYLAREKRGTKLALDPVAHFHLSNGARLERLNWEGDVSEKGRSQSFGLMVNYLYDGRKIDANHEAYHAKGRVVVSPGIRGVLKG